MSSAFWACSRFSAWSKTALCGPSSTSSVISSPRWAGRQCSTIAPGAAWPSRSASTRYGRNGVIRSSPSSSCPIEVQASVATASAPLTASTGSVSTLTDPPVPAAISAARATTAGSGVKPAGPATRTCMPAVAPPSRYEWAMLLAASPTYARVRPAVPPNRSRTVSRSARIWQGWKPSVSALTTGTLAPAATSAMRSSPYVRSTMAAT